MSEQYYDQDFSGSAPENYERYFVPLIGLPLAKKLIDVAAIRPGERVLDVACGTGVVARLAAGKVGAGGMVAGLDVNPGMLAVAAKAQPAQTRIQWHQAGAEAMGLPDGSFDVVLCQMGLQFIPDPHAALCEMHRVLAPGGRLVLTVPGPTPKPLAIMGEALARHVLPEAAAFLNQVFSLHDTVKLQQLIQGAGFQDVSVEAETASLRLSQPERFLWEYLHSTPLANAVAGVDDERRAALEREFTDHCREFVEDDALMLQVRMVVATAKKG